MKIKGFPVVNARAPLVINITARDTSRGHTKNPNACAAARACLREVDGCTEVRVHLSRTYILIGERWHRYATSPSIRAEIIAFDRGGSFAPGQYMLGSTTTAAASGKRTGSKTGADRPRKLRKQRMPPHIVQGVRPMHPRGRADGQ